MKDIAEEIIALLPNFLRYARTRVSDLSEAEDLVNDVALRMIEKASDLVSKKVDLLPYGITAIRNLAVDRSRLAFSSHASIDEEGFDLDGVSTVDDIQTGPEASMMAHDIWSKVAQLGEECEAVITLTYIGLSYEQIADQLSWNANTVGTRLLRCRKNLIAIAEDLL